MTGVVRGPLPPSSSSSYLMNSGPGHMSSVLPEPVTSIEAIMSAGGARVSASSEDILHVRFCVSWLCVLFFF